jgi:hypothetical protein
MLESEKQWNNQNYSFYLSNLTHFQKSKAKKKSFVAAPVNKICRQGRLPPTGRAMQHYPLSPPEKLLKGSSLQHYPYAVESQGNCLLQPRSKVEIAIAGINHLSKHH